MSAAIAGRDANQVIRRRGQQKRNGERRTTIDSFPDAAASRNEPCRHRGTGGIGPRRSSPRTEVNHPMSTRAINRSPQWRIERHGYSATGSVPAEISASDVTLPSHPRFHLRTTVRADVGQHRRRHCAFPSRVALGTVNAERPKRSRSDCSQLDVSGPSLSPLLVARCDAEEAHPWSATRHYRSHRKVSGALNAHCEGAADTAGVPRGLTAR